MYSNENFDLSYNRIQESSDENVWGNLTACLCIPLVSHEVPSGVCDAGVLHPRLVLCQSSILHSDCCHLHHAYVFVSSSSSPEKFPAMLTNTSLLNWFDNLVNFWRYESCKFLVSYFCFMLNNIIHVLLYWLYLWQFLWVSQAVIHLSSCLWSHYDKE